MKRRTAKSGASAAFAHSADLPDSLTSLVKGASPLRILTVDIDQPLPDLRANDHYSAAYVLLSRKGVYRGEVVIDLLTDAASIQDHLREAVTQLKGTLTDDSVLLALSDRELPRISIVVPTIVERIEELRRCIASIEQLDYPNFELLLVDNRRVVPGQDPLPALVHGRTWLRVIRESRSGISAARNEGVANADGDVVAFTDDDVRVDPQWLRALGTRLALNPDLDAVTGLILPAELESPAQIWFERYYNGFNGQRTFLPLILKADGRSSRMLRGSRILARDLTGAVRDSFPVYGAGAYAAGANMAFRTSTLRRIGGFDVALGTGTPARGGEDLAAIITVLWTRGSVGYEPTAVVHHRHRSEYVELLTLMDGEGTGFTAMLTSLVRDDPRHVFGLSVQFLLSLRKLVFERARRLRGLSTVGPKVRARDPLFPPELSKREFRACLRGPRAYLRSRSEWNSS